MRKPKKLIESQETILDTNIESEQIEGKTTISEKNQGNIEENK